MSGHVFIVHCVDTEGPLDETLEATFSRLLDIFGLRLDPSMSILKQLQNQEIDLQGIEAAVANVVAPHRVNFNRNWQDVSKMLAKIFKSSFRMQVPDSLGNGWCYSWFCVDHVGYHGKNPRNRDINHNAVFDFYKDKIKTEEKYNDCVQWHYHPLPINGNVNASGSTYLNSSNIWEILARKIIDRSWFPTAFRPGFHTERPDSNWFLEQWIPFDYANQSMENLSCDQPDLSNGRWGNWNKATTEWRPYHPSHDDYQLEGASRRWIARCLNMEARLREINQEDVNSAFKRAADGLPALLSFSNHDFRNMKPEIIKIQNYIRNAAEKFQNVTFTYENALSAFHKYLKVNPKKPGLTYKFSKLKGTGALTLNVLSKRNIFGPQPFLALKTKSGEYFWQNFDFRDDKYWSFCFDESNISPHDVSEIAIAANSASGLSEVLNIRHKEFLKAIKIVLD